MNSKRFSLLLVLVMVPILLVSPVHAQSGFIASSTNSTSSSTKSTDPNYNTYQNLALGFSINYLKNMTVTQQDYNLASGGIGHLIIFQSPHRNSTNFGGIPHLTRIRVLVTPSTGAYGIQQGLDEDAKAMISTFFANNLTNVTSKSKGSLNSLPAYRIEDETTQSPVNYTGTTGKVPVHFISYLTVKDQILYVLTFSTFDKNPQTDFIPIVNKLVGSFQYN